MPGTATAARPTRARPPGTPGVATAHRDGAVVRLCVRGRLDPGAVDAFAAGLREAIAAGHPFAVVFDRRDLGAPTPAGMTAWRAWAEAAMPLLPGRCTAWADVFDERRAAVLERAAADAEARAAAARATAARTTAADSAGAAPAYPRRTFTDPEAASCWCLEQMRAPGR